MLRKGRADLDLLARRHPALKTVGAGKHAGDQRIVIVRDREPELAVHDIVRKIGTEPHFGHGIDQLERRVEIVGDAISVGFELDRHALDLSHLDPGANDRHHLCQSKGRHLPDDVHADGSEIAGHMQHWPQSLDRFGERHDQTAKPVLGKERPRRQHALHVGRPEIDGHAVIPGLGNHLERLLDRHLDPVGPVRLHRPKRLVDLERHENSDGSKSN